MARTSFEITEFNDPAFVGLLLPILKEIFTRTGVNEIKPEDYIHQLAHALFTNQPVKIYTAIEKPHDAVGAIAQLPNGGLPPRVWIEILGQAKKFARQRPARKLYQKIISDAEKSGIKEMYCIVRKPAAAKLFMKEATFRPKEVVLVKKIGGMKSGRREERN